MRLATRHIAIVPLCVIPFAIVFLPKLSRSSSSEPAPADDSIVTYRRLTDTAELQRLPPEMASFVKHRAALAALAVSLEAAGDSPGRLSAALMGNLDGYIEPCACSAQAATGGLAAIASLVAWWRARVGVDSPVIDVGQSLAPRADLSADAVSLFRAKADVVAECYGRIGVSVVCPSASDLGIFSDLADLTAWSRLARAPIVITNAARQECVVPYVRLTSAHGELVVASMIDVSPAGRERHGWLALCDIPRALPQLLTEVPHSAFVIVVVHTSDPQLVSRLPRDLVGRALIVVSPVVAAAQAAARSQVGSFGGANVLSIPARGQGVRLCEFMSTSPIIDNLGCVTPAVVALDYALRSGAPVSATSLWSRPGVGPTAAAYAAPLVALTDAVHREIGFDESVRLAIRAYEARVFAALLARDAEPPRDIPPAAAPYLPSTCEGCHQGQVASFVQRDPHRGAYERLLLSRDRRPDFSCLRCHLAGFAGATVDGAVAERRLPWSLRSLTAGPTCVSCHTDATAEHIRHPTRLVKPTADVCVRCHDEINSPTFDFNAYGKHLGCCQAAGTPEATER